jgi:dTDP-4-amino-4,6-dideoxygalactose transaminase
MGEKERNYVNEAFDTNWIAPLGPHVDAFEQQLSSYLNVSDTVSLSSGTAAIHLALQAVGVNRGDVVLCQSFTFAASAFPINYCEAEPVFIDSEKDTWNMDPDLLEEAISELVKEGKRIGAIIVVHLYGMPAKMNRIIEIANAHQIPVIEDAAEALGSTYFGKACGSMGSLGILSFNGNKIITTSGGGALAGNEKELIRWVRHVSAQAKEPAPYYLHKEIGYNYRLSNICAGIGRGQMEVLPERIKRRRKIFDHYRKELSEIEGLIFLSEEEGAFSNRWLTTVLFDDNIFEPGTHEKLRLALEALDIESRQLWKPLHQQPLYERNRCYLNGNADYFFSTGLCLPSGSNMTDEVQERVIAEIKRKLIS